MKRYLSIFTLLICAFLSSPLDAEDIRAQIAADYRMAARNSCVYPEGRVQAPAAAPEGYEPVFIYHHSRHGSRYNGNSDSLQNVINQIKDDQLTFYALPFSILYGVDEWKVPEDQNDKVAAIARVMKDNDAVKFNLVGFCDHTGSAAYNMKLSQKRAEELKRVLVKKYGIDEDRLTCDWKGKGMAFGDLKYGVNRRTSVYRVIE